MTGHDGNIGNNRGQNKASFCELIVPREQVMRRKYRHRNEVTEALPPLPPVGD
jgi:hypothetical protein